MANNPTPYKRLDAETVREITRVVIETHKEEEARAKKASYDNKRANIKLLLRNYRGIVNHVRDAVYEASQLEYDLELKDILELMSSGDRNSFRVDSIRENVATARIIVDHMDRMLKSYEWSCNLYGNEEDKRRCRVIRAMYVDAERKTADDIAEIECVDKSTVYRDIDAAADKLAVLFFGVYGLKFL